MAKLRKDHRPTMAPHENWSMDWMCDELFDGRRIWVLTIVDNLSRVSPAVWVGRRARATDVVDTLNQAISEFGCPERLRVDNGSQFHLQRTGPVGLYKPGHLGFLPEAYRQCLY